MPGTPRDLDDYVRQYRDLPFEGLQLGHRRRHVLARIAAHRPTGVLEVGCGDAPLFPDLPGLRCAVVEPAASFAEGARRLAEGNPAVAVLERPIEDVAPGELGEPFDVVVLSGVLHEVTDPQAVLTAIAGLLAPAGVLHVNVPNAGSLHRRLAVAMGLIPDLGTTSQIQRAMQQRGIYDRTTLDEELVRAGFGVVARGGILVKPFTHAQMQHLVDDGFLTDPMLDGLDRLAEELPELASEIWADARRAAA